MSVLDRLGVPYMITGSCASSLFGEPRASHDVDLVVDLSSADVDQLIREFRAPRYLLVESAARDAVSRRFMFNVLDTEQGDKVDFWLLTADAFDQSRFARRTRQTTEGCQASFSSPEDVILAKLRWAKLSGGSEKQLTDALGVYEVQRERLDRAYLERWVKELNIEPEWRALLARAT